MREMWFAVVALLGLLGTAATPAPAAGPVPAVPDTKSLLAVHPNDRILGNPSAPITIIEYASLSCPHCAHFENEVLPPIKKKWIDTGKAKLILRDFPLDGEALRAAMIARCASPSRFYAFIETFFADQQNWVPAKNVDAALARLAKLGGMGQAEVDACLKNKPLEDKILESRLIASKDLHVDATPTFFINGSKFEGAPTVEAFNKLLADLSAKS
jgi:protein-disulfide isomerase